MTRLGLRRCIRIIIGKEDTRYLSSWERVHFEWQHYGTLRNAGLSHRQTVLSLDRMWESRK